MIPPLPDDGVELLLSFVSDLLNTTGATPIFAVTADERSTYEEISAQLGRGSTVTLESDSENIADAVRIAFAEISGEVTEAGTDEDDSLMGTEEPDVVLGGPGNDQIEGGENDDVVDGGSDDDIVLGEAGDDTVRGGTGADTLNGGPGKDIIEPGAGIDVVTLGMGSDIVRGTARELNGDRIEDFEDGDQILVLGSIFGDIAVASEEGDSVLSFDESSITLQGEFSEGDFTVLTAGTGDEAVTSISFNFGFSETSADGLFLFRGNTTLQALVTQVNTNQTNQLVAFVVDDAQGTVNGVAPDSEDYLAEILARDRNSVIFSTLASDNPSGLPNDFSVEGFSRALDFIVGTRIGLMVIAGGTLDRLQAGQSPQVFFSNLNNAEVVDFTTEGFNLNFQDRAGGTFEAFQVAIQALEFGSTQIGTALQNQTGLEAIDLREEVDRLNAQIMVNSEAAFSNFVDFYKVVDESGGIDTNGDGVADVNPGDTNYAQTAIEQRLGLDITDENTVFNTTFEAGDIFAPFIIADGNPDTFADTEVYFPFVEANADGANHLISLGDNTFGFEDSPNGGDLDFDDMIVQVQFL